MCMPPKTRITKDMIIKAAIEIAKQSGYESINARTVSEQLHCSTQPVMYHFSTIDALKRASYAQVDHLHSKYLMTMIPEQDPILGIGLNYIRFAVEEPQLFRLIPVLIAMQEGAGLSMEKTKQIFLTVALFAHGYASIIANNGLEYDEKLVAEHLERAWNGAFLAAVQEEKEHEKTV